MNTFIFQVRSRWLPVTNWTIIVTAVAFLLAFTFSHMPAIMPETGFASSEESVQFDRMVSQQNNDWKYFVSALLLIPACMFLSASLGQLVEVVTATPKRYAVLSALVMSNTVSIGMAADRSMIDNLDHVNYIATQHNIDCCREALMDQIGWPLEKLRDEHRLAFMVKELNTVYRHQIRMGDALNIQGILTQTGPDEIELTFKVFLPEHTKPAVKSKLVMPLVSLETNRRIPIPDWLRQSWEESKRNT